MGFKILFPLLVFNGVVLGGVVHAEESNKNIPLGFSVKKMDTSVDPKQDFLKYAAGTWIDKVEIPSDQQDIGSFRLLKDKIETQLNTIIRQASKKMTLNN